MNGGIGSYEGRTGYRLPRLLARLLPPRASRRSLPLCRWLRGLLPHQSPVSLPNGSRWTRREAAPLGGHDALGNCALGAYNFEFMTDVTTEIVHTYKVDGISVIDGRVPACVTARVARTYSMITRGTICRAPRIRRIWCDANIYSGASRSSSILAAVGYRN